MNRSSPRYIDVLSELEAFAPDVRGRGKIVGLTGSWARPLVGRAS